jgi:putative SOS response-associated peptidase YedK
MCGRLNVTDDPRVIDLCEGLGIKLNIRPNPDLRPAQIVTTVASHNGQYQQLDLQWGIKPSWAKSLLINSQAETVATKPTFKRAFTEHRCLVPCAGWYEWRDEGGPRKKKYLFTPANNTFFLMAGIFYPGQGSEPGQLVTLTTTPNEKCAQYHHRMPVLVQPADMKYWFNSDVDQLEPLLGHLSNDEILVQPEH